MQELSFEELKTNLNDVVDKVIEDHQTIRIKRRSGKDFVVIGAEDWEREQETMYVLGNPSLMSQIAASEITYRNSKENQ